MELLTLPRLRNHQLQSVTEDTIKLCQGVTQLKTPSAKVSKILDRFKGGMTKDQASAAGKKDLDGNRDRIIKNFMRVVKAESCFPFEKEEAVDTINRIKEVVGDYGIKITRLSYNEESAAIDNLLDDLKRIDFTAVEESGLKRWIPKIQDANTRFKEAARGYIEEGASVQTVESATAVAPSLKEALNELYSIIYAHLKLSYSDELNDVYKKLELLVNGYR